MFAVEMQIYFLFQSSKPDEQHRLRCVLSAENQLITRNSLKEDGAGSFGSLAKGDGPNKQIEVLTKKVCATVCVMQLKKWSRT